MLGVALVLSVGGCALPGLGQSSGLSSAADHFSNDAEKALVRALANDDWQTAQVMIHEGASIDAEGRDGVRPLVVAMSTRKHELVKLFLQAGASPNFRFRLPDESTEWTPLLLACAMGDAEMVQVLYLNGARPVILEREELWAFKFALVGQDEEVIRMLIELGFDVNSRGRGGQTPLYEAASARKFEAALLLLDAGADPALSTSWGGTPLTILNRDTYRASLIGVGGKQIGLYDEVVRTIRARLDA